MLIRLDEVNQEKSSSRSWRRRLFLGVPAQNQPLRDSKTRTRTKDLIAGPRTAPDFLRL